MTLNQLLDDELAGLGAIAFGISVTAWKIYLRVRRDSREDKSGSETQEGYSLLLDEAQETIERQARVIDALGSRLDVQIGLRHTAEEALSKERVRNVLLEHEIRRLGGNAEETPK